MASSMWARSETSSFGLESLLSPAKEPLFGDRTMVEKSEIVVCMRGAYLGLGKLSNKPKMAYSRDAFIRD